ncbi:MAG: HelD family protein [Clostridia bacterium]
MINNEDLKSEKKYLNGVIATLDNQLQFLNNSIYDQEKNLQETSQYMANSVYGMDAEEQAVAKQMMEQLQLAIIAFVETKALKERQRQSPYFGRIDFIADDEDMPNAYYIGIAHIGDEKYPLPLVLDWRAPLSSMYYDYELGGASYHAPQGEIAGKILLKRQYKTEANKLVYAFDSNLTIGDEILRSELGKGANAKMKNIVATIQSAQNKIIRAPQGKNLIVQGVAGSGKTSIALHRVAYLLYNSKIKASDILIISPSSLFSDYISNVLPELGEANTPKITFDEIAQNELLGIVQFESKSLMLEDIIENKNCARAKAVQEKSSFAFLDALKKYLETRVSVSFVAQDIKVGKAKIKADEIAALYNEKYQTKTPAVRVEWIADYIVDRLDIAPQHQKPVFARVKRILFGMFKNTDIVKIYLDFLKTQKLQPQTVKIGKKMFVGYEEVAGILFVKNFLMGIETQKHFKHIIIDEMQDYSATAMAVLDIIYPSAKTILGDINQTLERNLDKGYLKRLARLLGDATLVNLETTYRSTLQIATFSQKIIGLRGVKNFNRTGEDVMVFDDDKHCAKKLCGVIKSLCQKHQSVAVVCQSKKMAEKVFAKIPEDFGFDLIDDASGEVKARRVVLAAAQSKGLEFDAVIYIGKKSKHEILKNIKYVACTRALHNLVVVEV